MSHISALSKRKRVVLTLNTKLDVIKKYKDGESVSKLALFYGVGIQTVRDILKNKDKLFEFASSSNCCGGVSNRKTLKMSDFPELESLLFDWFKDKHSDGVRITGQMLVDKAQSLHRELGMKKHFNASIGWLTRFQQRHGIRGKHSQGKLCSVVNNTFESKYSLFIKHHKLTPKQIYYAAKTQVYWRDLSTLFPVEDPTVIHSNDELVTVMCCANANGTHKLKLVCIGKEKRLFLYNGKDIDISQLPVEYYKQSSVAIDCQIFRFWFTYTFLPAVVKYLQSQNLPEKAVLFLDGIPFYPLVKSLKSADGQIFVQYLPFDASFPAWPNDRGIIKGLRYLYKLELSAPCVAGINVADLTIVNAMYALARAWHKIRLSDIIKLYHKFSSCSAGSERDVELRNRVLCSSRTFVELLKIINIIPDDDQGSPGKVEYVVDSDTRINDSEEAVDITCDQNDTLDSTDDPDDSVDIGSDHLIIDPNVPIDMTSDHVTRDSDDALDMIIDHLISDSDDPLDITSDPNDCVDLGDIPLITYPNKALDMTNNNIILESNVPVDMTSDHLTRVPCELEITTNHVIIDTNHPIDMTSDHLSRNQNSSINVTSNCHVMNVCEPADGVSIKNEDICQMVFSDHVSETTNSPLHKLQENAENVVENDHSPSEMQLETISHVEALSCADKLAKYLSQQGDADASKNMHILSSLIREKVVSCVKVELLTN